MESPEEPGQLFDFLIRNTNRVMKSSLAGAVAGTINLLDGLFKSHQIPESNTDAAIVLEKLFLYALTWSLGGLLEDEDRNKFDTYVRGLDPNGMMPECEEGESIYEYFVNTSTNDWSKWQAPQWEYPQTEHLDFSNILVPTMDSVQILCCWAHAYPNEAGALDWQTRY